VTLAGIPGGYDIQDGSYSAWCSDDSTAPVAPAPTVTPLSTLGTLPANIQNAAWPKVNYVLNNQIGNYREVQQAIWLLLRGEGSFTTSANVLTMVSAANANGANFQPMAGQKIAVLMYQDGFGGLQDTIIEVTMTESMEEKTYELGDRVWKDLDRDGIQDPGEPGINGVTVKLTKPNGTTATTTTATVNGIDGIYKFTGLQAGQYIVEVDGLSAALKDLLPALVAVGNDRSIDSNSIPTSTVLGADNPKDYTLDFGYVEICNASVGDFVWLDINRNGVQDAGEPGIGGVTVQLFNSLGGLLTTASTDTNGRYLFSGRCGGTYRVGVIASTAPAGLFPTSTNVGSSATDSNPNPSEVTLNANTSDLTYDFGFRGGTGCTYTQGYWKNHAYGKGKKEPWPVDSITLGTQTYTKEQILAIWDMPVTGNATINLAHQLFAAKLNLYNEASLGTNAGILAYVAQAEALIANRRLPFTVDPATGAQMIAVKTVLDQYNNGRFPGTAHCE
jgi:hypothetical protein